MNALTTPVLQSRSLTEEAPQSDIDQMLHEYVKPTFLKMSAEKRQKAIEILNKMASED